MFFNVVFSMFLREEFFNFDFSMKNLVTIVCLFFLIDIGSIVNRARKNLSDDSKICHLQVIMTPLSLVDRFFYECVVHILRNLLSLELILLLFCF